MSKRKSEDEIDNILTDTGLPLGWVDILKTNDKLPTIIAHLINISRVDEREIKRAKIILPSFSKTKWKDVADKLGYPDDAMQMQLSTFSPPDCFLPPSFHEACFINGWKAMDVFSERLAQDREAARLRLLDPVSRNRSAGCSVLLVECS